MKTFTTSDLVAHLRKHPAEHKTFEDDRAAAAVEQSNELKQSSSGSNSKQLTLEESQCRSKVWDINDPRALCVNSKIGEMIALDSQPFSIVDDAGFISLLHSLKATVHHSQSKIYYRYYFT